jgi:hypothetical protein
MSIGKIGRQRDRSVRIGLRLFKALSNGRSRGKRASVFIERKRAVGECPSVVRIETNRLRIGGDHGS